MDLDLNELRALPDGSLTAEEVDDLCGEIERLREALNDIWSASRDAGMASMINYMQNRAGAALMEGK